MITGAVLFFAALLGLALYVLKLNSAQGRLVFEFDDGYSDTLTEITHAPVTDGRLYLKRIEDDLIPWQMRNPSFDFLGFFRKHRGYSLFMFSDFSFEITGLSEGFPVVTRMYLPVFNLKGTNRLHFTPHNLVLLEQGEAYALLMQIGNQHRRMIFKIEDGMLYTQKSS